MKFYKMHGTGNDFIIIEAQNLPKSSQTSELAQKLCDRHFSIGADGLVIYSTKTKSDARMIIYNPDGTEAEMCGNAIRCIAKYMHEIKKVKKGKLIIETLAGDINIKFNPDGINVNMGIPKILPIELLEIDGKKIDVTCVDMGNPHAVLFVDNVKDAPVNTLGPKIEIHSKFPDRTNVEFVEVKSDKTLNIRVWERGVGETLACGTGACASLVAAKLKKATVNLPGGSLIIEIKEDSHIWMTGPAEFVFEGEM